MPPPTRIPSIPLRIQIEPLAGRLFSDFGTVIENPAPGRIPSKERNVPQNAVSANQGTAHKYIDVSRITNFYGRAPSSVEAKPVMNMFVCSPRDLHPKADNSDATGLEGIFRVSILERHPFTSQTFIPLGLSREDMEETRYLVIVAPSLPPSARDQHLPVPTARVGLPGRGLPDLRQMRAFIAHGSQGVTYGAGTWHAPMVVLSKGQKKAVDFVVVQYANGVDMEDCQEVVLEAGNGSGISVMVQQRSKHGLWKL